MRPYNIPAAPAYKALGIYWEIWVIPGQQMMATEYIDNEAMLDDTSACTITSPPFAKSPDLKKSPISIRK